MNNIKFKFCILWCLFTINVILSQGFSGQFETFNFTLPDGLERLPEEEIKLKFGWTGNVPDLVYSDLKTDTNISFIKTELPIDIKQLPVLKSALVKQFDLPNVEVVANKIMEINTKKYVFVKISVLTPKGIIETINLSTDINGKLVTITISYLKSLMEWETKVNKFINSLVII